MSVHSSKRRRTAPKIHGIGGILKPPTCFGFAAILSGVSFSTTRAKSPLDTVTGSPTGAATSTALPMEEVALCSLALSAFCCCFCCSSSAASSSSDIGASVVESAPLASPSPVSDGSGAGAGTGAGIATLNRSVSTEPISTLAVSVSRPSVNSSAAEAMSPTTDAAFSATSMSTPTRSAGSDVSSVSAVPSSSLLSSVEVTLLAREDPKMLDKAFAEAPTASEVASSRAPLLETVSSIFSVNSLLAPLVLEVSATAEMAAKVEKESPPAATDSRALSS
mmetsp:Transcript_133319/g.345015  ORF Transcript_133319/g.345015 Transcript_133319/m.345015 type:complete len:278 (-) Transcript_133319:814-1647(-)